MSTDWMDPKASGPTALCVTNMEAQAMHREASESDARGHTLTRIYDEAKVWCLQCPARQACLDEAMEHEVGPTINRAGVRGSLTPRERAELAGYARRDDHDKQHHRNLRRRRRQGQATSMGVACPTCGQGVGDRCVSKKGNATEPHLTRVMAAEAVA